MKQHFWRVMRNAAAAEGAGGGDTAVQVIAAGITEMKGKLEALEQKSGAFVKTDELAALAKAGAVDELKAKLAEMETKGNADRETIRQINEKLGQIGDAGKQSEVKSVSQAVRQAFREQFDGKMDELQKALKGANGGYVMEVKAPFLLSTQLTGDPEISYNTRQALNPSQKVNFRELVPTIQTESGLYVTFKETGLTGAVDQQTEGAAKAEVLPALTEVKTVQEYIAGTTTTSKQALNSLSFLEGTLTRILNREYFKKENAKFMAAVNSAATAVTPVATTKIERLIELVAAQNQADFNGSVILLNWTEIGAIYKELFSNQQYQAAGTVVAGANSGLSVMGVPVVGASWATAATGFVVDADMVERIEREALNVTFSYENADNFTKNLVTVKIEAQTELNIMLNNAHRKISLTLA